MIPLKKNFSVSPNDIAKLIKTHYANLMPAFYELQSSFLCDIYKRYGSIEKANIVLCFSRDIHLEIIRQREKDLNFDVSLQNFWANYTTINKPTKKITTVVKITGIPKETVRRKVKNLMERGFLEKDKKNKSYFWGLIDKAKEKEDFFKNIEIDTNNLSIFISKIVKDLGMKASNKTVEDEIRSQFSFYWYHFLSCQLEWLKWWQVKLKDNDLLLIALQATIPTLQFIDKNMNAINIDEVFKIIGQINKEQCSTCSISATSVSEITAIPRATVIRKLDKLVNLGFLVRELKSKRYSINQSTDARTKTIMSKDNVNFTIKIFSDYIAIILNSLIQNRI
tara:strand:- start:744 stop:1754 length:1011 start_codon:yes stop_codon:yes gene_type:complete